MSDLVCLDHNANTYVYDRVRKEMNKLYRDISIGNASSRHQMGQRARDILQKARQDISDSFHVTPDYVTFTSGATESINMMILGRARYICNNNHNHNNNSNKKKVCFVSTRVEHPAVLNCFRYIERTMSSHIEVCYMDTTLGLVDEEQFKGFMKDQHKQGKKIDLVSFSYVNHELGSVMTHIKTMIDLCHKYGALFHSDMTQAAGKLKVNMKQIGADAISFSAHKFHGPMGVGCLLLNPVVELEQLMFGGDQENKRRPGTENVVGIHGMSLALQISLKRFSRRRKHFCRLYTHIKQNLEEHKVKFRVNACHDTMTSTMSLSLANVDASKLVEYLNEHQICVSRGTACKAYSKDGSNVIMSLMLPQEYAEGTIRISFCENTTTTDVDKFLANLIQFVLL